MPIVVMIYMQVAVMVYSTLDIRIFFYDDNTSQPNFQYATLNRSLQFNSPFNI